jgi:peptidoglycan hydrolase CwlO-like protein
MSDTLPIIIKLFPWVITAIATGIGMFFKREFYLVDRDMKEIKNSVKDAHEEITRIKDTHIGQMSKEIVSVSEKITSIEKQIEKLEGHLEKRMDSIQDTIVIGINDLKSVKT